MKVKIINTGEVVEVTDERANYWIRCNVAKEVVEKPKKIKK